MDETEDIFSALNTSVETTLREWQCKVEYEKTLDQQDVLGATEGVSNEAKKRTVSQPGCCTHTYCISNCSSKQWS